MNKTNFSGAEIGLILQLRKESLIKLSIIKDFLWYLGYRLSN